MFVVVVVVVVVAAVVAAVVAVSLWGCFCFFYCCSIVFCFCRLGDVDP